MVLDCRRCSVDRRCHRGTLALDTSHFTYLARAALRMVAGDAAQASDLLAELLRASSCWEPPKLWTTAMIESDQVDQQLSEIGLAPPEKLGWFG